MCGGSGGKEEGEEDGEGNGLPELHFSGGGESGGVFSMELG